MKKLFIITATGLCSLLLPLSQFACSRSMPDDTDLAPDTAETATQETMASVSDEVLDVLAKADAADGEKDHIVAKCITCQLHMAGKADHTATVGEYSLYLCSDFCLKTFAQDATKYVTALKIDEVRIPGEN